MTEIVPARSSDLAAISALLGAEGLPTDGVADHVDTMFVARQDGRITGVAGLELYGDGGLLRSVVVDRSYRNAGLARQLVEAIVDLARARNVPSVYLLTTTAADYFPRLGFTAISRDLVPPGVQQSVEFVSACPASASVMVRQLS